MVRLIATVVCALVGFAGVARADVGPPPPGFGAAAWRLVGSCSAADPSGCPAHYPQTLYADCSDVDFGFSAIQGNGLYCAVGFVDYESGYDPWSEGTSYVYVVDSVEGSGAPASGAAATEATLADVRDIAQGASAQVVALRGQWDAWASAAFGLSLGLAGFAGFAQGRKGP